MESAGNRPGYIPLAKRGVGSGATYQYTPHSLVKDSSVNNGPEHRTSGVGGGRLAGNGSSIGGMAPSLDNATTGANSGSSYTNRKHQQTSSTQISSPSSTMYPVHHHLSLHPIHHHHHQPPLVKTVSIMDTLSELAGATDVRKVAQVRFILKQN